MHGVVAMGLLRRGRPPLYGHHLPPPLACRMPLTLSHRRLAFPAIERLTSPVGSAVVSDVYVRTRKAGYDANDEQSALPPFAFAVKDEERGLLEHGVEAEARRFIAEAEAEYAAVTTHLDAPPGGATLPEQDVRVDEVTGATVRVTRIAAPFAETVIPSSQERFAHRGHTGELAREPSTPPRYLLDGRAQLNLKKNHQLDELLSSPMPALPKTRELSILLRDYYAQCLALPPRSAEAVFVLYAQVSLQLRLQGRTADDVVMVGALNTSNELQNATPVATAELDTSKNLPRYADMHSVPFLREMRSLYAHQKVCFVAPTPLTLEHMMLTLSAIQAPCRPAFLLANRLLLDCDKYVVLPTRTTYAAYFTICQINDAMPFAVARMTDAVLQLHIPLDAAMATSLLKGLNELGYAEEAVALLARLSRVPMTTALLNVALETLLLSSQPLACFAAVQAVREAGLRLNGETYTLLLLACEKSAQWGRVTGLLAEMQRHRVKGNSHTLNLLLKGLMKEKLDSYALQLHATMVRRGVPVWPALQEAVTRLARTTQTRLPMTHSPRKPPSNTLSGRRKVTTRR